jgi:hypothetical protein
MSRKRNEKSEPSDIATLPAAAGEENVVAAIETEEICLQAEAEQTERVDGRGSLPAVSELSDAQSLAMSPGFQALWNALLPLEGAHPSRPGEFPGVFKVEPGEEDNEALVYLDVPAKAYRRGQRGDMARVLALSVKLSHDYRRLGDQYYCIDCESPSKETRH